MVKKKKKSKVTIFQKQPNPLTLSQKSPGFMCLQNQSFENTVGKGEIACIEQFLPFPQCFLPVWKTFFHFNQI